MSNKLVNPVCQLANGERSLMCTHLSTAIDGLSEPDVLLVLGAPVPVLAGDALGVGVDAGLARGEVTEDLDGVHDAALVGVDPVVACSEGETETLVCVRERDRSERDREREFFISKSRNDRSFLFPLTH